jgi:predicted GNAT family N-acyltransferase
MAIAIQPAQWDRDAELLLAIRRRVFIEEQAVPEALELDGEDAFAQHWLARCDGEPVGTARMLRDGHIGRVATLPPWRGRGVGAALLAAAIAQARAADLREVHLDAQTHALPFYQRHGFSAYGPEFMDAGIPHRSMRLLLREQRRLGQDSGRFAARDRRAVALDLARQCRRQLRILSNSLEPALYHSGAFAAAVSQLARGGRDTEIRLLILDSRPLVQREHALVALQRRLSSSILLRRANCDAADIRENYLIADNRGVLCFTLEDPDKAWSDYNNGPLAEDYRSQFDEWWQRSAEDPQLRLLAL